MAKNKFESTHRNSLIVKKIVAFHNLANEFQLKKNAAVLKRLSADTMEASSGKNRILNFKMNFITPRNMPNFETVGDTKADYPWYFVAFQTTCISSTSKSINAYCY